MVYEMNDSERLIAKNSFDGSIVFQKQDFEKITGRDAHRENLTKADLYFNKFIDPVTQQFSDKYIDKRDCPVCDSGDNNRSIFVKNGANHVRCGECDMIFVNPTLEEAHLMEYYQNDNSWMNVLKNQIQMELDKKKYKYALDLIRDFSNPGKNTILDVGCAGGLFLDVAAKSGWDVFGVEINKQAIKELIKKNIYYWDSIDSVISSDRTFDAVAMWDLFEHLYRPSETLKDVSKILRKGGVLFMNIPNVLSLSSRLLREKSGTFDGRSHINFFSEFTIAKLLNRFKFTILNIETIVTELKTISNYMNYDHPYAPSFNYPYFPLFTPEVIHRDRLGSRLLVYAVKN